jgi:hypothetical protein
MLYCHDEHDVLTYLVLAIYVLELHIPAAKELPAQLAHLLQVHAGAVSASGNILSKPLTRHLQNNFSL